MEYEAIITYLKIRLKNNEITGEEYKKLVSIADIERKPAPVPKVEAKYQREVVGSNFLSESKVWKVRAEKLVAEKRVHEALETIDKSIELYPKYVSAWVVKAKILEEIECYEEAVYAYSKILAIKPGDISALKSKGTILKRIGRQKEANLCFSEVSKVKSTMQLEKCRKILQDYHQTHTYVGEDIYVCGDMACDIWDILKTMGINARIAIGNPEKKIEHIFESNHAWVIAELGTDMWKNLETTYGKIIEGNPFYDHKFVFETPKEFKEYFRFLKQYNESIEKYNQMVGQYNRFIESSHDDTEYHHLCGAIDSKKTEIDNFVRRMEALVMNW